MSLDGKVRSQHSRLSCKKDPIMKRATFLRLMLGGVGGLGTLPAARGQAPQVVTPVHPPPPAQDRSLQLEIEHAIDRGLHSLEGLQNANGYWSTPETPGLTALVLTAYVKEPSGLVKAQPPEFVRKGYDYLLQCQQPDGGIYLKGLANYCTSVCVEALLAADPIAYERELRRARMFLIGQQGHFPPGSEGAPYDGGIGYGDKSLHFDVSNTSFALEALHETRHLAESSVAGAKDLNWKAAVAFLERCQNLPDTNHESWVKGDAKNLGGFVYDPLNKKGLLSYGSMSYAGLLSYIHADLKKDDPRVIAVFNWLQHTYTLEENPGMGADGLYYYYHTMSKALSAHGTRTLALADGREVTWASELALKLINLQQTDGSWVNSSGRWWEKDPTLVTAYAVRTLENIHAQV
jgi:squalene-hopene/tetraprenyl-beta-curcumene cyclase